MRVMLLLAGFIFVLSTRTAAGQNAIQQENSLPGTPGWNDFAAASQQDALSGFGSTISVNRGGSIDFYVTTTAASFKIDIYRTGYYQGIGARLVQSLGSFPGVHQAIPSPDPITGIIACTSWTKTTTLLVPSTWVSGVYLAKLTTPAGGSSFIFFVVRNDGGNEDVLFQTSVTTYQAYNIWGGTSLYDNQTNKSIYPYAHATKVSFDRPFDPQDSNGAGHYFLFEQYFVYWLEQNGYNVAYTTNVDTDSETVDQLTNHKAFLSVGHDEYWTRGMRTNVENAISAGVNVGFFSANSMYWQIRFEPNSKGVPGRVEVGYKDFAQSLNAPGPDPQFQVNNPIVTTNWRDPLINEPENAVIGVMFESAADGSYVVQNASNWIYDKTGFVNGTSIPGIVGYEYDKVWNNGFSPAGLIVLSQSPVVDGSGLHSFANSTLYTAPSGARVFASGTIEWSYGLASINSNTFANTGIMQATANILNNFIIGTPIATVSPASINFNGGVIGTPSAPQSVTITSKGAVTLNIGSIGISGLNSGDFSETNNCPPAMTIDVSCTVNVTFNPTAAGARMANLVVNDNTNSSPETIPLSGIGQTTAGPLVSLSPASVSFSFQNVGTISPAQMITLSNFGTAPLSINSIGLTGSNPADFVLANNCPSTIAIGGSCVINVKFSPTLAGTRSANVTITDNAVDSPESVPLTGSAVTPTIFFKDGFEAGNFNKWTLVSSDSTGQRTVQTQVVNTGTHAAGFTNTTGQYGYIYTALATPQAQTSTRFYFQLTSLASSTPLAIARNANGGSTWEVDFNANRKGLDIYFWNNAGTVYGIFSAAGSIAANNWYCVEVGDIQTITGAGDEVLVPPGQAWLEGVSLGTVNADLSNTNPFARLMLYNGAAGTAYFDDVVVSNLYNGPVTPAPEADVAPLSLTFGNQPVTATSDPQTITLTNGGTLPLSISSIGLIGTNAGDYAQTTTCPSGSNTLAVNTSCTISVTFTPSATGASSATLVINDNDPSGPQSVPLSGTGIPGTASVTLSTSSLGYGGEVLAITSSPQTITVTSTGNLPVGIGSIGVTGLNSADFAVTSNCPTGSNKLAVNASCAITATFTPTATGTRSASVTITDNAANSPQNVAISGIGQATAAPLVSFNPASLTFASQNVATFSAPQTITLFNIGTAPLSISSIAFTGTNPGDFSSTNNCPSGAISLAVNASCTISVTFSPVEGGTLGANLTVTDNAEDSPESVPITGLAIVPTIYFKDGFESGDFSAWNLPSTDTTGQRTAQTQVVNTGTYAATFSNTSGQFSYIYTALAAPQVQTFTRFYFQLNNLANSTAVAIGRNANGANTWEIDYDGARQGLDFFFWDSSGAVSSIISPIQAIVANAWYCVEIGDTQTTTGQAQAWLNGVLLGTLNGDLSNANPMARLMLYTSLAGSVYYDDVVVSNVYNGPISPIPMANVNPTSVNFGNQAVNTTSISQTVTLTNQGVAPLSISSIALSGTNSGDFAQTNNCPSGSNNLAIRASCTINVTFTPTATGARSATLVITDNDPTSPQNVSLSGSGTAGNGGATLSPTTLTYSSQVVGTTSAAQTITLTSTGAAPLSISSIALAGTNSGDFTQTNNCPTGATTLAVNASCIISVTFTPTAAGARSATLVISDNDPTSPQSVPLSGSGTAASAGITLSPTSLTYSGQVVGTTSAAQTVSLTNSGTAPLTINNIALGGTNAGDFAQTNTCPTGPTTLAVNASCTISVTFTPTAAGARTATVVITDNGPGSPQSVPLSGSGTAAAVTLSPTSLTYSGQVVGTTSAAQTVTLTNSGTAALSISSIALGGTNAGDFAQTNTCPTGATTLAVNAACTITVTFTPTATGVRSATVVITDNGPASPQSVPLSGSGIATAVTLSPASLTYSGQLVGTSSAAQTITVTNSGTAPLTINNIALGGTNVGDFAQTNNCPIGTTTLAISASCTISVTFTPTATGARSATVVITDNGPPSPQSVALSGSGTAAAVTLSPTSLPFGSQLVGTTSAAQAITVTSTGTAPLSIGSIALGGTSAPDFAQTSNCPIGPNTLAVNTSCTISVTFRPTTTGARTAILTLNSNAPGTPPSASLSGTGVVPVASLSPTSLTFATLRLTTTSAAKTVTLRNSGGATLHIASIAVTGDFAQTNTCSTILAAGSSCTVSVTFSPTATGTRTGALTVTDDSSSGSPQSASLSGTGADYTISASPSSATVTAGSTASSTVTVSALGGNFTFGVNLSCSSLPKGAKCSFSNPSLTPGTGSVSSGLSISTTSGSNGTPKGTYTVTINGASGSLRHTAPFTLQVN